MEGNTPKILKFEIIFKCIEPVKKQLDAVETTNLYGKDYMGYDRNSQALRKGVIPNNPFIESRKRKEPIDEEFDKANCRAESFN